MKRAARPWLPLCAREAEDPRLADSHLCFVGVNTNSSFPVTGGNTEAFRLVFPKTICAQDFNVQVIEVSDGSTLFRHAVPCVSTLMSRMQDISVILIHVYFFVSHAHNAVLLPDRYAQLRTRLIFFFF